MYKDMTCGRRDDRRSLSACLKALRHSDTRSVWTSGVWKLDSLGRNLRLLVSTVHEPTIRGIGFKVLTSHGAIDTTTPGGKTGLRPLRGVGRIRARADQ